MLFSEEAFTVLSGQVVSCERCPRLRAFCNEVAQAKRRAYSDWTYWGKPLPGFGDMGARLLIIGLAPAAHGGNRTGRMFTGDSSGDWLMRTLFEAGFANQPQSLNRDDGLTLRGAYITAIVRCAPPNNKPTKEETANCSSYLTRELELLQNVKLVLTLGKLAFDAYLNHVDRNLAAPRPTFRHGSIYELGPDKPTLMVSYHPSRQNTQTHKLTWEQWSNTFDRVVKILE